MGLSFIIFGLILQLLALNLYHNEAIVFKFTNAVCDNFNASLLTVNECRLRAVNRNKTTLNINVTLWHSINAAQVQGQLFKRANGYKPWLYKENIDCCRFLRKPYNPIAIIVVRLFKEFSNFNHTCPYVGPILVKGFYLRWEMLPHAIPTGDYLLSLKWFVFNKLQIVTNIYFQFAEDL